MHAMTTTETYAHGPLSSWLWTAYDPPPTHATPCHSTTQLSPTTAQLSPTTTTQLSPTTAPCLSWDNVSANAANATIPANTRWSAIPGLADIHTLSHSTATCTCTYHQ